MSNIDTEQKLKLYIDKVRESEIARKVLTTQLENSEKELNELLNSSDLERKLTECFSDSDNIQVDTLLHIMRTDKEQISYCLKEFEEEIDRRVEELDRLCTNI